MHQHIGQHAGDKAQHRGAEQQAIGIDLLFGQRAQDNVPAHRMTGQNVRPRRFRHPVLPQGAQVFYPSGEIVVMAGHRIKAEAS